MILPVLIIALLLIVAWQDYEYRAVTWYLFPILIIGFVLYHLNRIESDVIYSSVGLNLVFILLLMLSLTAYFSVKHKTIVNIAKDYLGLGDILFLLVLAVTFSPLNYVIFFIASLALIIILALFIPSLKKSIPLAGIQALCLIPFVLLKELNKSDFFYNENWILMYFL